MTRQERIKKVILEKDTIIAKKKSKMKQADGVVITDAAKKTVVKAVRDDEKKSELDAILIINTTNFMDSHSDVHIPGLWSKSLQENKNIMHLQEHKLEFEKIIADGDDLNVYTKTFNWSDLGYPYPGQTEALVFDSKIRRERNEYMFNQYKQGRVNNHSVGMGYVKILLAVDDPDETQYYENWEKYIDQIANKEKAQEQGYFWVIKEAKVVEGSAVPIGSNTATPTYDIKSEPFQDTLNILKSIIEPEVDPLNLFINKLKL